MSLGARASNKGGTRSGGGSSGSQTHLKHNHNHVSHKNTDKSQRGPVSNDDLAAKFRDKVAQLMETTRRSEEEVCAALYDCDDDLAKACDLLFEEADGSQGQWKTKEKKKKKSVAVAGSNAVSGSEGELAEPGAGAAGSTDAAKGGPGADRNDQTGRDRPSPRTRSNPRPYRGRGGDYQNSNDIDGHSQNNLDGGGATGGPMRGGIGSRRGGRGGSSRGLGPGVGGRGGSRGGRGGRGGRGMRGQRSSHYSQPANESPWDLQRNDGQVGADGFPSPEDWDNEEWSGSLADTKVFTPSGGGPGDSPVAGADAPILNHHGADLNSLQQHNNSNAGIGNSLQQEVNLNMGGSGVGVSSDYMKQGVDVLGLSMSMSMGNVSPPPSQQMHQHQQSPQNLTQDPAVYGYANSTTHHVPKAQSPVSLNVSSTLSAAQSQYLSQLTQQKSESLKQERNLLNSQQGYSSNYGVYGSDMSNQRKPLQRARVPPPSKIPSSAVEMPGELDSSSVGLLGVQFGAMDFNTDATGFLSETAPSSAAPTDKFNSNAGVMDHSLSDSSVGQQNSSSSLDSLQTSAPSSMVNDVSPSPYAVSSNNSSHVLTSESLSAAAAVEQASSGLSGPGGQQYASVSQSQPASRGQQPSAHVAQQLTTVAGIESQLTGKSSSSASEGSQQSVYSSYPGQTTYKQPYHTQPHHAYPANPYSQVNSSVPSFTAVQSLGSGNASVTYPPTNTLNQYQHTQPINTYQNSSSVYGNSGLYTAASVPYNNYQTSMQTNSNKLSSNVKESQYESAVTSASNSLSNTPTAQSTQSSKSSTSLGKSIATSGLSSGSGTGNAGHVNAMMGQYIMSQPFYPQQPLAYTYEEMQMLQQRLPHHMTGYYDMSYGSSGGGGAGRDASMPSFTSLGSADGRFGRADAPSPSQQAQVGHQALQPLQQGQQAQGQAQPPATAALLGAAGAAMQPYAYFYGGNIVPGGFQPYGTPPMFQIATGGSAASSSYAGGKGVSVGGVGVGGGGGGYASGAASYAAPQPQPAAQPLQQYDTQQVAAPVALPQPAPQHNAHQDYKTGGYSSTQQTSVVKQSGVSNSTSAATDLNSTMYGGGKTHVTLNKVNSYDKVAYNSATPPPPFGLGAGGVGVGVGSGAGYVPQQHLYLQHTHSQMPPPQQQHHQPQHQMDVRVATRRDNGTNSSRGGSSGGSKQGGGGGGGGGAKQAYSGYWNQN